MHAGVVARRVLRHASPGDRRVADLRVEVGRSHLVEGQLPDGTLRSRRLQPTAARRRTGEDVTL